MANYDLAFPGAAIDAILTTAYDLQNAGYIFKGSAYDYTGTPTERTWLIAGEGFTGFGFTTAVPKGCVGICLYNGSTWSGKVVRVVTIDVAPTSGSTNAVQSGAVYNMVNTVATGISDALNSLTFQETTVSGDEGLKLVESLKMTSQGVTDILTSFTILAATTSKAGLMSASDKAKLDAILTNIRSMVVTDTTLTPNQGTELTESLKWTVGGTQEVISAFTILAATTSKAGLMSAEDKTKLNTLFADGYKFAGIAVPSSTPMSTTAKIFYIATQAGTYTLFGDITLTDGINVLMYSGSAWSSAQLIGFDDFPTVFSKKLVTSDGIFADTLIAKSLTTNCFYIDPDHAASYNNGNFTHYGAFSNFDALWIRCIDGATRIRISGADPGTKGFFSELTPTPENCLGYGSTSVIPEGTKLIIVDLGKNSNPNGYANMKIYFDSRVYVEDVDEAYYSFTREHNRNVIAERGGISIDYKHLVNNPSSGVYIYDASNNYDCMWIPIFDKNISKITLHGFTTQSGSFSYNFFNAVKESDINTEHLIEKNQTGRVPAGAVVCIVNSLRETHTEGYEHCWVEYEMGYVTNSYLDEVFGEHIVYQKNLINPDDLLRGYVLNGSQIEERQYGIMSNKINFVDGVTYAFQNIQYYGNKNKIYICHFDEEDNYIGSTSVVPTIDPEETKAIGSGLYRYSKDAKPGTAYCRVQLQTRYNQYDIAKGQIEVGTEFTEIVGYNAKQTFIPQGGGEVSAPKKKVSVLLVGNSYSQDAMAYVPFIMENMGVEVDFQLGILMLSSSTNEEHIDNFNNEAEVYTFYLYNGGGTWQNLGHKSIQWALDSYQWELISLQGGLRQSIESLTHATRIAPDVLANLIAGYVDYPVKFVWYHTYTRPAKTNASIGTGYNYTDEEIRQNYEWSAEWSLLHYNTGIFEYVIPVGTATENARTIASLKAMGAYSTAPNNSSGLGYLACADGVHLQEGLPSQIAAYTWVMSLLDIYGFDNISIVGETTRVTTEWEQGKNIPGPHGECIGSTDENCLIAQKSVVMAMKKKFEVTDMNYIVNPT